MSDWREKLDGFLQFNERAVAEYDQFDRARLEQADDEREADTMRVLEQIARDHRE